MNREAPPDTGNQTTAFTFSEIKGVWHAMRAIPELTQFTISTEFAVICCGVDLSAVSAPADVSFGRQFRRHARCPRYVGETFPACEPLIPFPGQEPNAVQVNEIGLAGLELGVPGEPTCIAS